MLTTELLLSARFPAPERRVYDPGNRKCSSSVGPSIHLLIGVRAQVVGIGIVVNHLVRPLPFCPAAASSYEFDYVLR
jgi:hypothetical protein